ncbi:major facilitator superfamily domain-containing protein [Geopyxis carbonaria]|nr:major facilitator superfamily domain-containing protein [Geopyxis carbonaria]
MGFFLNPFSVHNRDRAAGDLDVVVPLDQAHRHVDVGDEKSISSGAESGTACSSHWTLDSLRAAVETDMAASGHDAVYDRKSKLVNKALQDIGMGRYQWALFCLCGFGWFADNLWLQGLAVILTSIQREFNIADDHIGYTTTALFIGLCLGASVWGILSDVLGRRIAFNTTLGIAGVFGLAVGGAPTWLATAAMFACLGTGVGGNLPVDGALYLEFLPTASGNLLTLLSAWWPVGQLVGSLLAWGFLPNYSCSAEVAAAGQCTRENNMGWRYLTFTMGAMTFLMFIARFFMFHLFESPKYYLSRGKDELAVAAIHGIAARNGVKTWLTLDILREVGGATEAAASSAGMSTVQIIKAQLSKFGTHRLAPLFAERKLAINTVLIWFCWATIGMGYPLFNAFLPIYLTRSGGGGSKPNSIVYRNYAILSIVGLPGSLIAYYTVDIPYIGRKGTMAISTLLSGIFLFLFTLSTDDNYQLAFSSLESFFQNAMYGVLYAYTPEVFPAPNRGTGTGVASLFNRVTGLCAPIIATNTLGLDPRIPVWIAGALILSAFVAMVFLPIETRGRQKL